MSKNCIFLLLFLFVSNVQFAQSTYTIGSSENVVLEIQGEPSAVSKIGHYTTFSYGRSTITFKNGVVHEFNNAGSNLHIKLRGNTLAKPSPKKASTTVQKKKPSQKRITPKRIDKWMYFTFTTTSSSSYGSSFGSTQRYYSNIFTISNYTTEMQNNLEFCLKKSLKQSSGDAVYLTAHVYDNRETVMALWNTEDGILKSFRFDCNYLMQYGVTEH